MKIDLHLHSYYSDGSLSPANLLQKCKDCGLEIIALTDHESSGGIPEAQEAGKALGIRVLPGMEFTTVFRGREHHILGYFMDFNNPRLAEFLRVWKETKAVQIQAIIKNLQGFGFKIFFEEVMAQVRGSLDRYHIASALFPNSDKSAEEREKRKDFFRKFLFEKSAGGEGLAFIERERPDIQSVLDTIHHAGGIAFWAHPFFKMHDNSLVQELALVFHGFGLDGLETFYSFHDQNMASLLHKIAQDNSMHESCGSDFHRDDSLSHDSVRQIANFQDFGIKINLAWIER